MKPKHTALEGLQRLALEVNGEKVLKELEEGHRLPPSLDLFHVFKIKYDDKSVEITFHDRQKALEALLRYEEKQQKLESGTRFIEALDRGARAIDAREELK